MYIFVTYCCIVSDHINVNVDISSNISSLCAIGDHSFSFLPYYIVIYEGLHQTECLYAPR